ncbi:MAG: hypothetical protein B7X11_02505, partial [Acidobacteria bacterium 37-65-4]
MNTPNDLKYTKSHEWIRVEGNVGTVGITDFAQHELGDIVFVEPPAQGSSVSAGAQMGSVESVKAVSEVNSPASGTVVEVNAEPADHPELLAARSRGIPATSVQQLIADAAATRAAALIGVAGTHGKSTTTGWLIH